MTAAEITESLGCTWATRSNRSRYSVNSTAPSLPEKVGSFGATKVGSFGATNEDLSQAARRLAGPADIGPLPDER